MSTVGEFSLLLNSKILSNDRRLQHCVNLGFPVIFISTVPALGGHACTGPDINFNDNNPSKLSSEALFWMSSETVVSVLGMPVILLNLLKPSIVLRDSLLLISNAPVIPSKAGNPSSAKSDRLLPILKFPACLSAPKP